MPELTSPSASSSSLASAASTIRASRPSPSRTRRPDARASAGSNESTVAAAPARRCVSTSASTVSAVSAGTSPFSTSTSPSVPSRAARAARTASPVPSAASWTATSRSSYEPALSGDATTTIRATPASRAAAITQSTMRRPRSGCRCFGVALFMRVPRPPASTTAARSSAMCQLKMAGAPGFEPGITGPKPVALPLGHAPSGVGILAPVREDEEQGDEREQAHEHDRRPEDDEGENGRNHGQKLRYGENPRGLMERVRAGSPTAVPVEDDRRDRKGDDREAGDVVEDRDDDRLGGGDPKGHARPPRPEPAARPARPVLDRVRRVHEPCQPYHAGAVSQLSPAPFSARCAACARTLWWKSP